MTQRRWTVPYVLTCALILVSSTQSLPQPAPPTPYNGRIYGPTPHPSWAPSELRAMEAAWGRVQSYHGTLTTDRTGLGETQHAKGRVMLTSGVRIGNFVFSQQSSEGTIEFVGSAHETGTITDVDCGSGTATSNTVSVDLTVNVVTQLYILNVGSLHIGKLSRGDRTLFKSAFSGDESSCPQPNDWSVGGFTYGPQHLPAPGADISGHSGFAHEAGEQSQAWDFAPTVKK
jgi:hypothetical protein